MYSLCFGVVGVVLLAVPVGAINYPVGITNCGESNWVNATPSRAVALNQGATEVLLALNLTDRMVGTAFLDDEIWEELADRYAQVPVLAAEYPDIETLKEVKPDFLYAAYSSAFSQELNYTEWLGRPCSLTIQVLDYDNSSYCRKELHEFGIQTYLQNSYCERVEDREESDISTLFAEIWDLANIFDVHDQARLLIDSIDDHFYQAKAVTEAKQTGSTKPKILWLDGFDEFAPFAGV
jgi:iron complex transport system substrate-binding protein